MTVGSLFAGIGGFDLGFERAGFEIKWQVEINDYASRVLAKHWPDVKRYGDIRSIYWGNVELVDVLCGGFPCQPHSLAGARKGSADERDLWDEFYQAICILGPRWVVAENVPGLLSSESGRFFGRVLRDLAASGYGVEWDCIPASAVGAQHRRERVWIVAHSDRQRELQPEGMQQDERRWISDGRAALADAYGKRFQEPASSRLSVFCDAPGAPARGEFSRGTTAARGAWAVEPNVGRVAHGVPARVDRLKGLGNAVVPQITEWIAHRIKEAEGIIA